MEHATKRFYVFFHSRQRQFKNVTIKNERLKCLIHLLISYYANYKFMFYKFYFILY